MTEGVNHVTAQLMRDVKEIDPGLVQDLHDAEQERLKQLKSQVIFVCLPVVVFFFCFFFVCTLVSDLKLVNYLSINNGPTLCPIVGHM